MKRRYLLCILTVMLVIFITTSNQGSVQSKEKFESSYKKISVVMDDNYPPFVFRDTDGHLKGILIDQWSLWEKKTRIKVEINAMNWNDALNSMKEQKYDVIDTLFYNPERAALYDFTKPYVKIEVPIFFHRNISGITDVASLKGFAVAVKKGDNCIDILKSQGIDNIIEYNSYEEIINAAKEKKVVVYIMDKPPALYFMYKLQIDNSFNFTDPLYTGEFHRAVKKGNSELLRTVENGFALITEREYGDIDRKWYGSNYFTDEYIKYLGYLKYAALAAFVIILLLVLWSYSLKKTVNSKTCELEAMMTRMKTIIKTIPDLFFILNKDGVFLDYLSEESGREYYPKEFFLGKCAYDIFPADISQGFKKSIEELKRTGNIQVYEYPLEIGSEIQYFEVRMVNFGDDKILALVRDITKRKIAEKRIYEMSVYDGLTGLYNRNYFENEVARLNGENKTNVGLAICDIDGLKLVNDTMGHSEGDNYIVITSQILRTCFRSNDIIARIGGDEFAVLMMDTSEEEIDSIKKTIKKMTDNLNTGRNIIPVSMSLGYSILHDNNKSVNDIFKEADDYMYREKLYNLQSPRSKNIELLMKMLEARDFLTEDHGERLMKLAAELAKKAGMSENEVKDMRLLAQFHDIGKIGIPDAILFKPGRLTNEERIIMKRHTDIGYRIAQTSPDIMHISDWILKHHESWDGFGYPFGLKGEEIPLQCRILSIIDSYDAMTNDRPYRKALTREAAIEEIESCAGKQFDPVLAKIFVDMV